MKRTWAISVLFGLATVAIAQTPATPTVVERKLKDAGVKTTPTATATTKPVPANTNVKVVAVTPAKPTAAVAKQSTAKPAAVAVQTPTAKPAPTSQKGAAVTSKPGPGTTVAVKPAPAPAAPHVVAVVPQKGAKAVAPAAKAVAVPVVAAGKPSDPFKKNAKGAPSAKPVAVSAKPVATANKPTSTTVAVNETKPTDEKKPEVKKVSAAGRRDPFISPVVRLGAIGSGCSSGKRCLAIDQIALKGVVKSDSGMIAVVVNAMDKAYFLRENDPVFNGYVTKITPDSIEFKETFHDKLGKPLTRDVTKTISRPAA